MGKLVGILMNAVTPKRDRKNWRLRDKTIGQAGAAAIEYAVEEVPHGGRRHRHRLLQAPPKMFHHPTCWTSSSLLQAPVISGAVRMSSGEGHRFVLPVHGCRLFFSRLLLRGVDSDIWYSIGEWREAIIYCMLR
jgi:hypothetical protein